MGFFDSSSSTKKYTTYNTTTNTESNVGDIGLTGDDSVELAAVLTAGGATQTQQVSDSLTLLSRDNQKSYEGLIGAADSLGTESLTVAGGFGDTIGEFANNLLNVTKDAFSFAGNVSQDSLNLSEGVSGSAFNFGSRVSGDSESTARSALNTAGGVLTAERAGIGATIASQLPFIALAIGAVYLLTRKK